MSRLYLLAAVCALVSLLPMPGSVCRAEDFVDVVVVAPQKLYAGTPATTSVTVWREGSRIPASSALTRVWFRTNPTTRTRVFVGRTDRLGRLTASFDTPSVAPGSYSLEVDVGGLGDPLIIPVTVKVMPLVLIETDKPIYKPGQTIHGRVLVLSNQLKPSGDAPVSLEITDGKGVKIFRKTLTTNAFGVAPFDLDLASDLNFGTWKITAASDSGTGALDLRVERYVLPRFKVGCLTDRDYFLVDEPIPGMVTADYFFGKPVDGTVDIVASRYVGVWEPYASFTATLADGKADFELPEVGYVAGTGGRSGTSGGTGSVQLEVGVTDPSGHEERTTKLLAIVQSKLIHRLMSVGRSLTPGRPFDVLLTAEHPDGKPATVSATLTCSYYDSNHSHLGVENPLVGGFAGESVIVLNAPSDTYSASIRSSATADGETVVAELTLYAAWSPSDSFLHLSRRGTGPVAVGDTVTVDAFSTHAVTVYYDVFANGHTVFSGAAVQPPIVFQATPQMVPAARVVAYIINPNNEISADTVAFDVAMDNAAPLDIAFSAEQLLPGDPVRVNIQTDAQAMVGLSIVDESVYALNEGRLNMQEVFNELERRFMEPQSETHEESRWGSGAYEVFQEAGLQVVASDGVNLPVGWDFFRFLDAVGGGGGAGGGGGPGAGGGTPPETGDLAEVTRVRQFFPETWLWMADLLTAPDGSASIDLTAPDSITTWRLHAVSTSDSGLGLCESQVRVFQEFFGEPDLPYAVTRGERFPVRIQVFNYLDQPQTVRVELSEADWFDLLDPAVQTIDVGANSVALASFRIEPRTLGRNMLEVTLRSPLRADAVRKPLIVEAEGTTREIVDNGLLKAGDSLVLDANMPPDVVEGSGRILLSVTPSLVAQSINGIEDLLQMPYGCGEQNMIFFAPDVEILRYLDATGQLTPEVRAKAEHLITCGYQRELTYRRTDGSFSAFGQQDASGSLWLTAFVLGTFSGARDVQTIDESVLAEAAAWIESHQKPDGSWEPVGFVHHKEMLGGSGAGYPLTAFVALALAEYGSATPAALSAAAAYLQAGLASVQDDAYALAIAGLAFARLGDEASADAAVARLLEIAVSDGQGIHWEPLAVETTAYAAMALMERENAQANQAIKWLSLQRNSLGGYGSTQDTVMALKALMTAARIQTRNVNLTVTAATPEGEVLATFQVNEENFDVLQIAEIQASGPLHLTAAGTGETRFQLVRRFNVLLGGGAAVNNQMALEVFYDAATVDVDDIVTVRAIVRYLAPQGSSGMMIVDVGVPTGFAPVAESLDALVAAGLVSKAEVAGRKIILYVDDLAGGEQRVLQFQVKARFPVRAVIPDSTAYLYYSPDVRAEAAGGQITVSACTVDFGYLSEFAGYWLDLDPGFDYDASGQVDFVDFGVLHENWGLDCP